MSLSIVSQLLARGPLVGQTILQVHQQNAALPQAEEGWGAPAVSLTALLDLLEALEPDRHPASPGPPVGG